MTTNMDHDVLLVDDDPLIQMLVERRLQNSGLTLKTCDSGCKALDYLGEARVRLLLVDLHMKPMNGLELLETLANDNRRGSARAFLATSAMPEDAVCERLVQLDVGLVMKEDIVAAGGVARLMEGVSQPDGSS